MYTAPGVHPTPMLTKYMMHAGLRPLVPIIQWHMNQNTQTYFTSRRIADTVSRIVVLAKPSLGTTDMLTTTVQEFERGNAGQDLLEVSALKLIKSRSLSLKHATTQLTFWFPADDFLYNAIMINDGFTKYRDSKYVVDHSKWRVGPAVDDVYVFQASHYAEAVDPYKYDTSLPSFELNSGVAGLAFYGEDWTKLNVTLDVDRYEPWGAYSNDTFPALTPSGGIGDMSNMKYGFGLGIKTDAATTSPKCFYRDNLGYGFPIIPHYKGPDITKWTNEPSAYPVSYENAYKSFQPFTRKPQEVVNYPGTEVMINRDIRPGLTQGGVTSATMTTEPRTEFLFGIEFP
jgi:hypothetical protein